MARILVTNDDGVFSRGIQALARALDAVGPVTVLAPERNWSAAGHPKTMHKPLRIKEVTWPDGRVVHACSGAPSDCVALGLLGAVDHGPFELVVSGINQGYNLGTDVIYSGTVAGAMEAIINGVAAIAISVAWLDDDEVFEELLAHAAQIGARLAGRVLDDGLPQQALLNVNVPASSATDFQGIEVTRLGRRIYRDVVVAREDPWGRPYYWIGGQVPTGIPEDGSDVGAVERGRVSVTPVGVDLTCYPCLDVLRSWEL